MWDPHQRHRHESHIEEEKGEGQLFLRLDMMSTATASRSTRPLMVFTTAVSTPMIDRPWFDNTHHECTDHSARDGTNTTR